MAFFWPFLGKKCGFFGDGGSKKNSITCSKTLHSRSKHIFVSPKPSKPFLGTKGFFGDGGPLFECPLTLQRPHCFWPKKALFWPFLGKKSGFLVMVAPEKLDDLLQNLQNTLF